MSSSHVFVGTKIVSLHFGIKQARFAEQLERWVTLLDLILRSGHLAASRRMRSWFETREDALLTMRCCL